MNDIWKKRFTKKRIISAAVVVAAVSSYFGYQAYTQPKLVTKYVTAQAQRGMFIASLNGTGQVSTESQIDVKPNVSGAVLDVLVKEGQDVKKGDVLVKLDPKDALRNLRDAGQAVRDAQTSLAASQLSFNKLRQPATAADILSATDAVNQAQRDLDKLQNPSDADLSSARAQVKTAEQNAAIASDGKTPLVVRNAYDDEVSSLKSISPVMVYALSDADSIIAVDNSGVNSSFANLLSVLDQSQKDQAVAYYPTAKSAVQNAKSLVAALALQNEDTQKIDAAGTAVQDALDKMATLLGSVSNALANTITSSSFSQSSLDSLKSTIQSDRSTIVSKQTTMVTQQQTIAQAKTNAVNAGLTLTQAQTALDKLLHGDPREILAAQEKLKEAQQKLTDVKAGALPIDVQISQNSVDVRASALSQARNKYADVALTLNDYNVVAPFDGVIAKIPAQKADTASSGASVATIVAKQQIADITLNEVDAAKIKTGDKATLTFDAVDGLSITGEVDVIGTVGTVTQGIVNYDVKIGFDTQDTRVRAGMSVHASIITDMKPDVILVPNSAVKTAGGQKYVEILDTASSSTSASGAVAGTPKQQAVEVGLSNDTNTEITNGLSGGENVVTQTIAPSAAKTTAAPSNSSIRIPGITGGGFGGGRGPGG